MTDFRPGDIVTIELEVQAPELWGRRLVAKAADASFCLGPEAFGHLRDAGKVTLVRRAEPDWREGDIAEHIQTGIKYVRCSAPVDRPWLQITGDSNEVGRWRHSDFLVGKLVRCTVTPEVTSQDAADAYHHSHLCQAAKPSHRWTHTADTEQCDGWVKTCQDHAGVTS